MAPCFLSSQTPSASCSSSSLLFPLGLNPAWRLKSWVCTTSTLAPSGRLARTEPSWEAGSVVSARIHSVSTLELSRPGCPGNKRAGGVCRCQALNTNLSASRKVAWSSLLFCRSATPTAQGFL